MPTMPRPITPEDLYAFTLPEDPNISPDGTQVAYVQMVMDQETYEYHRSIWVVPGAGGTPQRFTSGNNDRAPRWSPDGRWLAFLRGSVGEVRPSNSHERDHGVGRAQIWVIPAGGGEAQQITFLRHGAHQPVWSPDSTTLLFAAETGDLDDQEVDDAALEGKNIPRVRTITQLWHRLDGQGFTYDLRSHLFTVSSCGGEPRQLTEGDWNDDQPAWSSDGRHIAFTSDRSEQRWQWPADAIWSFAVTSGECERLTDEALNCAAPTWSADGKQIAFLASPRRHSSGHVDLYTTQAQAGGEAHLLSNDFVPCCNDTCISDMRAAHGDTHLTWSSDNNIYFLASMRGTTHLYAAHPDGDLLPRRITDGERHIFGFSLNTAGTTLAFASSEPELPGDLYIQENKAGSEPQRLTNLNAEWLAEVALARPQEFSFQGADGWELQGWIMRPAHVRQDAPLPTILQIHGGPAAMYGYTFFHEFHVLAARGYQIVYSNPRGSTGYGRTFAGAVNLDWGGNDYLDIMAGLDAAIAHGGVDTNRLGVAGGSYGGYMTNWVVGHSDRFKAAVTMRCVANAASFFGTSDTGWWLAVDEMGATPWEDLDTLMRHSPITYVANIHAPLLILHSDNDLRCPISEGEQLFAALKYLGRETKFVRFEGQTHDLSRKGHPRSRVIRLHEIANWFELYIPAH